MLFLVLLAAVSMYWAHRALRMQYFRHCNRDLFRVIMFDKSTVCSHVATLLNLLEGSCNQAMKYAANYLITALGAVVAMTMTGFASMRLFRR